MPRSLSSLVIAGIFSLPGFAMAANHFVRSNATGTNDGSDWNNAYKSLPATLVRGDVYYVSAGAYAGRTLNTPASGTSAITIKKATTTDHGVDAGWNDAYGSGQATFSSGFVFSSPYWVIDGQTGGGAANAWIDNFGFKITEASDNNAVLYVASAASDVTVRHVDLQGKGSVSTAGGSYSNDGLGLYGAANMTLSYFHMQGIGRCPFFLSPRNTLIEHGWIQSFYGSSTVHSEVASIWGFAGAVGDITFRNNLFTDIQSTGGLMWDNSSNTAAQMFVYGNVFYKPATARWGQANGVIGGWTGGGGEQYRNVSVYNNTFINVDQESLSTFPNIYSNNVAFNNLFYNSASPSFVKYAQHDDNHFINSGGSHGEANGTSATSGDPFVNFAGLDFRLKAGTTAGAAVQAPISIDPFNKTRGTDGTLDRGAYEFEANPSAIAAPTDLLVN